MSFTAEQMVLILNTNEHSEDPVVLAQRKKINSKYRRLKNTKVLLPGRDGKILPGFTYARVQSQVWWLQRNGMVPPDAKAEPVVSEPPIRFGGCDGGGIVITARGDQAVSTRIVGRDATRFLSVMLPGMEKSDLIDIKHTIECLLA